MKSKSLRSLITVLILSALTAPLWASDDSPVTATLVNPQQIQEPFEQGRQTSRVSVKLTSTEQIRQLSSQAEPVTNDGLRQAIREQQERLLQELPAQAWQLRHRYANIPAFSAEVTPEALAILSRHPLVESIEPVYTLQPHLAQGIALMNAEGIRREYSGQGVAIAICDSGIDYTHPALGGGGFPNDKVIGGYDIADNDADPMPDTQAHGTACAGIAAGDEMFVNDYIGGVANNAKLYAMKITPGVNSGAYSDDIAAAWDWCVTHQYDDPYNPILVISTSFGNGEYTTACDSYSPLLSIAAERAMDAGITVLVSSGNDGYCEAIASPACISSVISVGAVYDADLGTYGFCIDDASCAARNGGFTCASGQFAAEQATGPDVVAVYSNTSEILDVLAPSHNAYTTDIVGAEGYSNGNYDTSFGGTSAACPYAAGAVACIQSASMTFYGQYLSPQEVRQLLIDSGDPVTDMKVATTKPRINVGSAISFLDEIPPTAVDQSVLVPFGTTVSFVLEASDDGRPEPGELAYIITDLPAHGILTEAGGLAIDSVPFMLPPGENELLYTPTCSAPTSLSFVADDGGVPPDGGPSNEAVVTLDVVNQIYIETLDTAPDWTMDGDYWQWGTPAGQGGSHGNPDPNAGATGTSVIGYNLEGDYGWIRKTEWLTTSPYDCTDQTSVKLAFNRWLNVEKPDYDHAYIQVSNNGKSWITVWQNTTEIADSKWILKTYDISAVAANQPTVYIRWGMGTTDRLWHYSGWNIDDVRILGANPQVIPGDMEPDCDVDLDDVMLLVSHWLQTCGDCQGADLLADGIVNLSDFALLAENWLTE